MLNKFSNQRWLKSRRKQLRIHATPSEIKLWKFLAKKGMGVTFRRQYSIGGYIVDFFCYSLNLIVEIDGYIHGEEAVQKKDKKRERVLRSKRYTIVRYRNEQVLRDTEAVIQHLWNTIEELKKMNDESNINPKKDPT